VVPRRVRLPGIEAFEGRSVLYAVRSVGGLVGKRVVIVGGGDSALDWTLSLQPVARELTLLHRRDEFRAAPASVSRMRELAQMRLVRLAIGELKSLHGHEGRLTAVTIQRADGAVEPIDCDMLLPFF